MDDIDEIREVYERIGCDIADLDDIRMMQHTISALKIVSEATDAINNVWKPRNVDTSSELLRALADIAEIGEERAAEESFG